MVEAKNIKAIADYMVECATKMYEEMGYLDKRVREIAHRVATSIIGEGHHDVPPTSFDDTVNVTFTWKVLAALVDCDHPLISYHWYWSGNYGAEWYDDYSFPVEFLYDEAKLIAFEEEKRRSHENVMKDWQREKPQIYK